MAGWSNLEDNSCNATSKGLVIELQTCFLELVSRFLNGSCENNCFRPLPPRLGNGDCVDLLALYFFVKKFGGFDVISREDLWGVVGLRCGFDSSFGCAFKLIYAKYLRFLESWSVNLEEEMKVLMEVERDYSVFMSNFMDGRSDGSSRMKMEKSGISFVNLTEDEEESSLLDWKTAVMDFADSEGSNVGNEELVNSNQQNVNKSFGNDSTVNSKQSSVEMGIGDAVDSNVVKYESVNLKQPKCVANVASDEGETLKQVKSEASFVNGVSSDGSDNGEFPVCPIVSDDIVKSSVNSDASKKSSIKDKEEENVNLGLSKEVSGQKRKRFCLSEMLRWMATVAKDPTDPVIGELPEPRKWASYGDENSWKQVLIAREALFLKKIRSNPQQSGGQKRQKLRPSLFESCEVSSIRTSCQFEANPGRPRQRLEAQLDKQPAASIYTCRPQQRIPIGKDFQAVVPEWTGVAVESDSKWLGTLNWPLERTEKRLLIERDPIGKGRDENCGCQFPSSPDCVKFHVAEKRMKMRFELGSAFYAWNFNKMGENCSISWTLEEEKRFKTVVKDNPLSMQRCFWGSMSRALPQKSWVDLVNYYFNVFMLRRRAHQNRHCPNDIDSDDDETEYRSTTNSIKPVTSSRSSPTS